MLSTGHSSGVKNEKTAFYTSQQGNIRVITVEIVGIQEKWPGMCETFFSNFLPALSPIPPMAVNNVWYFDIFVQPTLSVEVGITFQFRNTSAYF